MVTVYGIELPKIKHQICTDMLMHLDIHMYIYISVCIYTWNNHNTHEIIIRNKHKPNVEGRQAVASLSSPENTCHVKGIDAFGKPERLLKDCAR